MMGIAEKIPLGVEVKFVVQTLTKRELAPAKIPLNMIGGRLQRMKRQY